MVVFFNDAATTEIYTLSLHDALPISGGLLLGWRRRRLAGLDLDDAEAQHAIEDRQALGETLEQRVVAPELIEAILGLWPVIDLVGHAAKPPVVLLDHLAAGVDQRLGFGDRGRTALLGSRGIDQQHEVVEACHGAGQVSSGPWAVRAAGSRGELRPRAPLIEAWTGGERTARRRLCVECDGQTWDGWPCCSPPCS